MPLVYNSISVVDIFAQVVANLRDSGIVASVVDVDGYATISSTNKFKEGDIVNINSVDYEIEEANTATFKVLAVAGVINDDDSWAALAPYFFHGHPVEIANRLANINMSSGLERFKKFPLIALIQDFKESYKDKRYYCQIPEVILSIINTTLSTYQSEQRYSENFKPYIYPLYNDLIHELKHCGWFFNIEYDAIDNLFYGTPSKYRNEELVLNEFVDAREVFLSVDINKGIIQLCLENDFESDIIN